MIIKVVFREKIAFDAALAEGQTKVREERNAAILSEQQMTQSSDMERATRITDSERSMHRDFITFSFTPRH